MGKKKKEVASSDFKKKVKYYEKKFEELREELAKVVVGQHKVINGMIEALICNGHVLVEGVPGVGKTLLIKSFAKVSGCDFSRIQFTPDLLPTDIVGVSSYSKKKGFFTIKGPIFANFILADEINRSPPKVQSALLEGMQERQVTIGKDTFELPSPFFVMATKNPIEQLGTYKLPEAQLDRFFYNLRMDYPNPEEETEILNTNITIHHFHNYDLKRVFNKKDIIKVQEFVKNIYLDKKIEKYIVRIIDATRHPDKYDIEMGKYLAFGGSPRSSIAIFIAAKAHALLNSRDYVISQDIKDVAPNCLRHRILLNFEGEAEGIKTDDIIDEILKKVPIIES
jgi:MoxR-like ATPase